MPIFMNPFQKHDVSDFPGVYVPLEQSRRNASVVADHDKKFGVTSDDAPDCKNIETGAIPNNEYSAYTIEGLKHEIDAGMPCNPSPSKIV